MRRLRRARRDYMLVAAAGPASNLVIAFTAATIAAAMPVSPVVLGEANLTAPLARILTVAVQLNLLLAVFNMIPIPPLDGGNIAIGLLPPAVAGGLFRLQPFGILLLYALLISGALGAIIHPMIVFLQWLLFA